MVRCPNEGMRNLFHAGLVDVIKAILREVGVLDASVVLEARGMRAADRSRPRDVVAVDFFADGKHLVIDAVLITMSRIIILEKVATSLGYAAKQAEDKKFMTYQTSTHPI